MKREELTLDERIKALNDIDQEFDNDVIRGFGEALNIIDELRERIKKLEADKLRQENYCESLVNENKRLNEIIISKDMVGAELHNENKELKRAKRAHLIELGDAEECFKAKEACIKELEAENKALRFNLEDWKHKAEEMEVTAKSFDAEIARSHERIQKLTNENADLVMEVEKLQERIKELEDKVQMKDFFWEGSGLSKRGFKNTIEVANYIEDLESSRPKWISVEERLPPKLEDVLLTNGNECKQGYLCQYWCKENEPLWNFADGLDIIPTHWMPLPEPPTTEESSSVKEW